MPSISVIYFDGLPHTWEWIPGGMEMVDKEQDWEYGLRTEGHGKRRRKHAGPVVIGENGFHYQVSGRNWGQLPEGVVYREGTAVAVDADDQVYVFNRGTIPMLVFRHRG